MIWTLLISAAWAYSLSRTTVISVLRWRTFCGNSGSAVSTPSTTACQGARKAAGGHFHEIYLSASLEVCEGRDPKGHYKLARQGEIPNFTGVSAPYEAPKEPELVIDTGEMSVAESLKVLEEYVEKVFGLKDE